MSKLGDKSYEGWIFMAAPYKDGASSYSGRLKNANKKLNSFVKSKKMFSQFCYKNLIITDEQSLRFLGLTDCDHVKDCSENIYLLVPNSENVVKPGKEVNIEGKIYNLYKVGGASPENIGNSLIFPTFIEKSHTDAEFIRFNVDMNQNVSEALRNLYEILGKEMKENPESKISQIPKVLSF